eukprot:4398253-Pleurochrysis_carterae.AAC.6
MSLSQPISVPHRDGVATDDSAVDSHAYAQIGRFSSASDARTVWRKYKVEHGVEELQTRLC